MDRWFAKKHIKKRIIGTGYSRHVFIKVQPEKTQITAWPEHDGQDRLAGT
jgi:hypothetical protein